MSLERLLREGPPNGDVEGALESTRLKILDQGIRSDGDGMVSNKRHSLASVESPIANRDTQSSLRIYVWLILLNAPMLETDSYLALIHRGASPAYSKIRNDTFRTLSTDPLFRRRVSEASLIRLLNAFAWTLHDAREERTRAPSVASSSRRSLDQSSSRPGTGYGSDYGSPASSPAAKRARALTLTTEGSVTSVTGEAGTYVQGMNVLAAPFLYAARSEAEAYVAFHQLLTKECPGYIRGAMDGVHKGLALVDKVLAIVDPKLSMHLLSKNLSAEIYAFPSVLTLCACTPPLPEVLRLWDFLFAYGPHLNILCIVAQLVMIRTKIIESPRYVPFPLMIYRLRSRLTNNRQSQQAAQVLPRPPSRPGQAHHPRHHQDDPRRRLRRNRCPR
jgi:cell cycle arrest protein BUB2